MKKKPDLIWFAESIVKPTKGMILVDGAGALFDANRRELMDRANDLPDQVFGKSFTLVAYERVRSK